MPPPRAQLDRRALTPSRQICCVGCVYREGGALMQFPSVIRIVAFEFAGGDAFFLGLVLLAAAAIVATWRDGPRVRRGFRLATMCAAIVIAASGTPLPLWFYGIGVVLIVLSLWPRPLTAESLVLRRRFRTIVGSLALWCAVGGVWELSYRLPPRL